MEEDVKIEKINLKEVLNDTTVPDRIKYILRNNPYLDSENHVAMIRGIVKENDGGRAYPYPANILFNKKVIKAYTGSTFYVKKEYRKYMLGLTIPEEVVQLSESGITYGAGLSRDARPVYVKYLKSIYFPLQRYLYLRNARPLIDSKFGTNYSKFLSPICNSLLSIIHGFHFFKNKIIYRNYCIVEVADRNKYKTVEDIIDSDKHIYQEEHNATWFNWVLNAPQSHPNNYQKLFLIYNKNKPVAFWMIKVRYTKEIRGQYYDLNLGTIVEWGVLRNCRLKNEDVLSIALHHFAPYVDVIQLFTERKEDTKKWPFLKKRLGESNFFINVAKRFRKLYPGYENIKNWRLRPAMADTMFD